MPEPGERMPAVWMSEERMPAVPGLVRERTPAVPGWGERGRQHHPTWRETSVTNNMHCESKIELCTYMYTYHTGVRFQSSSWNSCPNYETPLRSYQEKGARKCAVETWNNINTFTPMNYAQYVVYIYACACVNTQWLVNHDIWRAWLMRECALYYARYTCSTHCIYMRLPG